jgi:hypothetical protein
MLGYRPTMEADLILNCGAMEVVLAERHAAVVHSWSHGMNGELPTVPGHVATIGGKGST